VDCAGGAEQKGAAAKEKATGYKRIQWLWRIGGWISGRLIHDKRIESTKLCITMKCIFNAAQRPAFFFVQHENTSTFENVREITPSPAQRWSSGRASKRWIINTAAFCGRCLTRPLTLKTHH
jgi:hypothetical protein